MLLYKKLLLMTFGTTLVLYFVVERNTKNKLCKQDIMRLTKLQHAVFTVAAAL